MRKPAAVAILLAFAGLLCLATLPDAQAAPKAPDFWLSDLTGEMVALSEYDGSPILLDFWASWCLPCRISIPELVELQDKYRSQGLVILGISMDDPAQASDAYLRNFAQKLKINYPILRYNQKVVQDYFPGEAPSLPTLFVIDRQGRIRDKVVGFRPGAAERAIKSIIE